MTNYLASVSAVPYRLARPRMYQASLLTTLTLTENIIYILTATVVLSFILSLVVSMADTQLRGIFPRIENATMWFSFIIFYWSPPQSRGNIIAVMAIATFCFLQQVSELLDVVISCVDGIMISLFCTDSTGSTSGGDCRAACGLTSSCYRLSR